MYSIDNIVTTSTCDKDGNLKLFSAFQMMQDCSEMWIESEPGVKTFFEESGMTQLLASREVEIVRVPRFKEKLRTVTSVFDVKPMFGFRNTFIYDSDGNVCYKTWSMGAFVNRISGKLQSKRIGIHVLTKTEQGILAQLCYSFVEGCQRSGNRFL